MKKFITILALIVLTANLYAQHYIGENYGGGIVFYVSDSGKHGLIAATLDQSTGIKWNNESSMYANPVRNDGIGIGRNNTDFIPSKQGHGIYAAMICARYSGGGYSDWYLPSKYELNLLYLQKAVVGGFASGIYWSSSELDIGYVWSQNFDDGKQGVNLKLTTNLIRAVRVF